MEHNNLDLSVKNIFESNIIRKKINQKNKVSFSDIIGYEKEKEELLEIIDFFNSREKYEKMGARIPKGILLLGQPGCGKTMLAKALINEINIKTFVFGSKSNSTDILSLKKIFNEARLNQPCLIFIDELEKLIFSSLGYQEETPFLRELLVQLDGFDENNKIIVIATANSTYDISPSLFRSGRFDRTIIVRLPDKEERKEILKHYSKKNKIASNVNFDAIANMTSSLTGADLCNILNDASLIAIRRDKNEISSAEINLAIDRIMFSAVDVEISSDVKKQVAAHEAGHALVAILRGNISSFSKVSIFNRGQTFGVNLFSLPDDELAGFKTKSKILDEICILLGGHIAESIICDDISTGSSSDLSNARSLSLRLIVKGMYGVKYITNTPRITELPNEKLNEIYLISDKILTDSYNFVYNLLNNNLDILKEITNNLIDKSTLFKDDLEEILVKYGI